MSRTELVSQVSEWVESIVADSPIERRMEYVKEAHGWVLRVYLDKTRGIDSKTAGS